MSTRQRIIALLPLSGLRPFAGACGVAAAIVALLAFAVLPADADPTVTAEPGARSEIDAPEGVAMLSAREETPTPRANNEVGPEPSPTPRLIRRPQPSPTSRTIAIQLPEPTPTVRTNQVMAQPTATATGSTLLDEQLAANRGFESTDSWYLTQGASIASANPHRGDGHLLLSPTGAYAGQRFAVEPNTTYRVAMYVDVSKPTATRARIAVRYENGAQVKVGEFDPIMVDTDKPGWQKVVFTFTTPARATYALLSFRNPIGSATVSVDDLSIRQFIPE